ncbi:hypothetical protein B4Q13_19655, partial [Lacticaseibacillus rhamnosus]
NGDQAFAAGYNLGQSLIWLVHPRVNLMLETVYGANQAVIGADKTEWARSMYVSPGIRWSYNFKNGLQIVPGIGVPIGAFITRKNLIPDGLELQPWHMLTFMNQPLSAAAGFGRGDFYCVRRIKNYGVSRIRKNAPQQRRQSPTGN